MNYVYQDASRKLGMLKRVFSNCDTEMKENLFNQLIRSKLEYACSAWDPHTIIKQRKLELIQKRAYKYIHNKTSIPDYNLYLTRPRGLMLTC